MSSAHEAADPGGLPLIQHVRENFACRACEKISQTPAPFHVIAHGRAGPSLLAMILYAKFALHQPLNRQSEEYAREGVDLPLSTLADDVGACAAALQPLVDLIRAHVLAGARIHGDDTPVPLLAKGKIWRDLFVRLAPSEQFVPTFKLPTSAGDKVEVVLETLLRTGRSSGSLGAMLSQGNLNTAALTLFLALHLSVPKRLPWLVLDDPLQSMDDVHIAQFSALLRTLSKGLERQLIVAVHERALFDYLTLELSPAFPGDSLISVEITRNFEGEAVAMPEAFSFEEDKAIAA